MAVVLLALGVAGLALGGDDGDAGERGGAPATTAPTERDTAPPTTEGATATSLATQEPGPVFGEPIGASLLIGSEAGGWRLVDLDTGAVHHVPALDDTPGALMVPVAGGVVVVDPTLGGGPSLVRLPGGDRSPLHFQMPRPRLAMVTGVLASGLPDAVWVASAPAGPPIPDDAGMAALVRIDGTVLRTVELPRAPAVGTAEGLVVSVGGRTYLHHESGVRLLGIGTAHAASASAVALLTCDEAASCSGEVVDSASGAVRASMPLPATSDASVWMSLSAEGALATLPQPVRELRPGAVSSPGVLRLSVAPPEGDVLSVEAPALQSDPVWLPGGRGLVVITGYGLVHYAERDGHLVGHRVTTLRTARDDSLWLVPHG